MKILRITLCNLASIAGMHTVDFTEEPLRSAGLFAISGPTGAGKSTLLDALCLALYDKTPRLKKLGRMEDIDDESQTDSSSLLRRGTGRGFVEVAFIGVDNLQWTARWEVRRARESAEGKLQNTVLVLYKGHIAPDTKGEVEEGGNKSRVLEAIENKIGLSFEQFTRAVLLAQNDFAAFLKASDKERAEILQKLTGTQQYEKISMMVFARWHYFEGQLRQKEFQIKSTNLLTDEERGVADENHKKAKDNVAQLKKTLDELEKQDGWYTDFTRKEQEYRHADHAYQLELSKNVRLEPRRAELSLVESIKQEGASLRESWKSEEERQRAASEKLTLEEQNHSDLESTISIVLNELTSANKALSDWKEQEPIQRTEIRSARDLDKQIALSEQAYSSAQVSAIKATSEHDNKQQELDRKKKEIEESEESFNRNSSELETLQPYMMLVENAALWINHLENLIAVEKQLTEKTSSLSRIQKELDNAEAKVRGQRELFDNKKCQVEETQKSFDDADAELQQVDIDHLENERSQFETTLDILRKLKGQLEQRNAKTALQVKLTNDISNDTNTLANDRYRFSTLNETAIPESQRTLKIVQEVYQQIAHSLEDHAIKFRNALVPDKACPVCGSKDHPYSAMQPTPDSIALREAKTQVDQAEQKLNGLKTDSQSLELKIRQDELKIAGKQEDLKRCTEELSAFSFENHDNEAVALVLAMSPEEQISETERCCEDIEAKRNEVDRKKSEYRSKSRDLDQLRKSLKQLNTELEFEQNALSRLEQQKDDLLRSKNEIDVELRGVEKSRANYENSLKPVWETLPNANDDYRADSQAFVDRFRKGVDRCTILKERQSQLSASRNQLNISLSMMEREVKGLTTAKNSAEQQLGNTEAELEEYRRKRAQLLNNRTVDEAEANLDLEKKSIENRFNEATRNHGIAQSELNAAKKSAEQFRIANQAAREKSESAKDAFETWLKGFTEKRQCELNVEQVDERLQRDLNWIDTERRELENLEEGLKQAKMEQELRSRIWQEHGSLRPTDQTHQAIKVELEGLRQQHNEAIANEQRTLEPITIDNNAREKIAAFRDELTGLEEEAKPWRELNEVIGSADGAKFRKIAQQLSLDILLQFANQQLEQLARRYRLKRLANSLNLAVIDCDMGEDTRSIYSLSGGETFLVSLALALGLASLTSNRVRIESLFIDEGFGSLDPETLNTAMGALMQLEAQGRKVGVISHVPEMSDAIPVQIKVRKGRNGASRIEIPGVKPLN